MPRADLGLLALKRSIALKHCGIVLAILIVCDLLSIFFKMVSSYMEWSIFYPILAHRNFETMFPKGRSPLLFKVADVSKTVHLVRG